MSLESLFTESYDVEYKGTTITIRDISLQEIPIITRVVTAFLTEEGSAAQKVNSIISKNFTDVTVLISVLTGIKKEDVSRLSIESTIFLLSKIIERNLVFIKKNIVPQITEIASKLEKIGSI